jgi:alpha/beta superfamily hydrolase
LTIRSPLQQVFDWARPLDIPVTVIPGADHFFHRKLVTSKILSHKCGGVTFEALTGL